MNSEEIRIIPIGSKEFRLLRKNSDWFRLTQALADSPH